MNKLLLVPVLVLLFGCSGGPREVIVDHTIVKTSGGYVRGVQEDSIYIFKGVPYAAPPTGNLRWKEPMPVNTWQDTLSCLSFGASPIQNDPKPFMMWSKEFIAPPSPLSEDCLTLNIWSAAKTGDKLPVFVWIHGGAFTSGSSACAVYDGLAMAKRGVVFVSINYRLGVFGFFAHPELTAESGRNASGNYGLMDQLAALRWIQDNIAAFGGDPSSVTIGGQSAGSMSVQALIASPLTKGLAHRAIGESGGSSRPGTPLQKAEQVGIQIAGLANAKDIGALRAMNADTLLKLANKLPFGSFSPNVDGYVLPADIPTIISEKKQLDVPLLLGWVSGDGAMGGPPRKAKEFVQYAKTTYGNKAQQFLTLFPANTDEEAATSQQRLGALGFAGLPDHLWAMATTHDSYLYEFTYVPTDKPGFPNYGAFHTSEVPFALHTLDHWDRPWQATDREVERYLSTYWTNFMKTGNPNGDGVPIWNAYNEKEGSIMQFGSSPKLESGSYRDAFQLLSQKK